MKKVNISVIILAKNASPTLPECLSHLEWAKEIILIDDGSQDETKDIAKRRRVTVLSHLLRDNFSAQRNWALRQANFPWVMFVDADEMVTTPLANEIVRRVGKEGGVNGYYLRRDDYFFGRVLKHGENSHNWFLRLAKKNAGYWQGRVHEKWVVEGRLMQLQEHLEHHLPENLSGFLRKINYYSSLRAYELYQQNRKVRSWEIIAYPMGKFFYNYFWRQGFRDGSQGFLMALLMAFHSFLVRAKLWHRYNGHR